MAGYIFVVASSPVSGREGDYNDWYDHQHLSDVLNVPGIVGACRYQASDVQSRGVTARLTPYLAIYDIDTDDLAGVFDEISARSGTAAMPGCDALDLSTISATVYRKRQP